MEKIAVFINDATRAHQALKPVLATRTSVHWILVACPPALTRHIGRWVSNSAREQWRERWAAELFVHLEPQLKAQPGSRVEKMMARRPIVDVSARLQARLGPMRLVDARCHRLGKVEEPITADQAVNGIRRWVAPVAITTSLSAVLTLAD